MIEPPGYGQTEINGLKAYCKVDFLFPVEDMIYIMDWKTGKADTDKHTKQMIGYSAWASYHFEHAPEKIQPIIAYLKPDYSEGHGARHPGGHGSLRRNGETGNPGDVCVLRGH